MNNPPVETSRTKKRKKNLLEDDVEEESNEKNELNECNERDQSNKIKEKSSKSTVNIETEKITIEESKTKDTLKRKQTRSNTSKNVSNDPSPTNKKKKKELENVVKYEKKEEKTEEKKKDIKEEIINKTREIEELRKKCLVEIVNESSCEYEDGTIFESVLVNKVKYSINDNVLVYYPKGNSNIHKTEDNAKEKNIEEITYSLKKGKISGIFQNFNCDKVEIEIALYFDNNDEAYIKELEKKQKSKRSKEDFVVFFHEDTKYIHLLGITEFKIIEANCIIKHICVYNEKRKFEKDTDMTDGKDKFLCLYYLNERENKLCEIQNEDHWDNLVLGSSTLYYYFTNHKRSKNSKKNKSLKLIIEKLKINDDFPSISTSTSTKTGSNTTANITSLTFSNNKNTLTMDTPRKAQTTSNKSSKALNRQQKAKTTTHKEISKEKVDMKKEMKLEENLKFDLQNVINEDKEKYYSDLLNNIKDPTDKAIRMMQLDVVPKYLPCREKEIKEVHTFLESGIKQSGSNQILYISGMPGTGKTATVYSVIQLLQMKSRNKILPDFNVYEINGMNVVHPNAAYQVFYKQLFNKKPPNALYSYKVIDHLFNKTKKDKRNVSVLIIDEIDYLITKTQKVLFTFFDWPTKVNSKLVLIAISNTMDLPERLIPRCRSRLAFGRLVFSPYKGEEIERIIVERLENCKDVMDHTAIQLCARKVANVSGDIRKALQICRKAFENKRGQRIIPRDITEASNQLFDSPLANAINQLPWAFKTFLTCILIELRMLNEFIIPFKKVVNRYKTILETSGKFIGMCSDIELFKIMIDKLVKMGLLLIRPYIPIVDISKKTKEGLLGFNVDSIKKNDSRGRNQVSPDIDKEAGDMGLELNVETQLIITALMKDSECAKKLNFFT